MPETERAGRARRLKPGAMRAAWYEAHNIARRPALIVFVFVMPLLVFVLLASIFRVGVPTELPIAVLDQDRSAISRQIVQAIDAAPEVMVAHRPLDLAEARQLVVSGAAYGLVLLPDELERDIRAGRRPEVVVFYNNQFMTPGSTVARGVQTALATFNSGIAVSMRTAQGVSVHDAMQAVNPIPVQQSPVFNPSLDYAHFLLAALMPTALQIFICAAMANAIALERARPGGLSALARRGGGATAGLVGKLLPYTILFCIVLALGDAVLLRVYGTPFNGDIAIYLLGSLLFILAYQGIGVAFGLLAPSHSLALGAAGLYTAPAFGFVGVSFPRLAMYGFAMVWSAILPLTWYLELRVDQMLRGVPAEVSLETLATLGWLVLAYAALAGVALALRHPRLRVVAEGELTT